jgi:radical SAM protein with 4Fe4S-binding SPASM domain
MSNFYCAAPWRGLHINPQGNVKTCCAGNPNMLGNLDSNTIEQILNNTTMQEVRESLAQGVPHEYCSNCVQAERMGNESERHWHNRVNPGFDYATAGNQYHYPVIVDVRWNTTCNLSCNYCAPTCSSKWASIQNVPFKSGARPYYNAVCDFIAQHYEHIHEVALVGGEPLLLPENERLLDVIPPDAIVTLITNLNVDFSKSKIFRKLSQRRRVGWSMSFDNTDQRFEYVRHGGSWSLTRHNIAVVQDLMAVQGHWGGIHAVYNIYNATRLCELRKFAHNNNVTVLWQQLFQPEHLDPTRLGPAVAELAIAEIDKFYAMGIATPAETQFFDQIKLKYQTEMHPYLINQHQFKKHTQRIETQYHTDTLGQFEQLWPELAFLCK